MLADAEEVALSFENTSGGGGSGLGGNQAVKTDKIRHPLACIFHLLFRSIAILLFIFSTILFDSFITIFVITILILSMDFWTTKNISGRLLVGLRWWNYVDNDGKSNWVFESRANKANNSNTNQIIVESSSEARLFWTSLILTQLIWTFFFIISFLTFKFKWLTIILVAFILNGSNLFGFLRCKFGSQQSISSVTSEILGKQMLKSIFDRLTKTNQSQPVEQNI